MEPVASSAQALLEVWESIAHHRDLPALIQDLKERLSRLVNFNSLWLVMHEPARDKMRLHIIGTPQGMEVDVSERDVEDSPSGWVWQTQQPLIVADTMKETRFPRAVELLRRQGVRSFCILPLTTAHSRLGGIGFGSQQVDAYRETNMEFLRYVAGHVAVAVDNALSHQDAQALQHQLERERDRLRLLLDLNNNIVSNLDLRELLRAISTNVRRVMQCDYTSVTLERAGRGAPAASLRPPLLPTRRRSRRGDRDSRSRERFPARSSRPARRCCSTARISRDSPPRAILSSPPV